MDYLHWHQETVLNAEKVGEMYEKGYVFTRLGKGVMQQTRSLRVNLSKFELSSENRRILKKTDALKLQTKSLPLADYDYKIGKLGKDFYDTKFDKGIMSAQKIKEMLTDSSKSNFNTLLQYSDSDPLGYAICYKQQEFLHYSYPFYDMSAVKDTGLGMMIRAIEYAKQQNLDYIYLGSLQRPSDTYKLQFAGIEWFNGGHDGTEQWSTDIDMAKQILSNKKPPSTGWRSE